MTALFQGFVDAAGVLQTEIADTPPPGTIIHRGMLVDPGQSPPTVVMKQDTGGPRTFQNGIAVEPDTGIILATGTQTPFTTLPGALRADCDGSLLVTTDPPEVIHQGVGILATRPLEGFLSCTKIPGGPPVSSSSYVADVFGPVPGPTSLDHPVYNEFDLQNPCVNYALTNWYNLGIRIKTRPVTPTLITGVTSGATLDVSDVPIGPTYNCLDIDPDGYEKPGSPSGAVIIIPLGPFPATCPDFETYCQAGSGMGDCDWVLSVYYTWGAVPGFLNCEEVTIV